jgi:aminoglycoside/choline kinase family phosphotransferase
VFDLRTGDLLLGYLRAYVAPEAKIEQYRSTVLKPGMSGAEVRRYQVVAFLPDESRFRASLITKQAELRERRVLALLNVQGQPNVPRSYTFDLTSEESAPVCMEDMGDATRPTSLDPITEAEVAAEAAGLAKIHAASMGQGDALSWLPRLDQEYLREWVLERLWRPAWRRARGRTGLDGVLAPTAQKVEEAAAGLVEEAAEMLSDPRFLTLIHADINPSNVLVLEGRPYFIDWQVASYGSLFWDLPHHFCTPAQAAQYRLALEDCGFAIPEDTFARHYRTAARCIGFRYIWWTLEGWAGAPLDTEWVHHYLRLILGD